MELFSSWPWTFNLSPRRLTLLLAFTGFYCYILWLYSLDIILPLIFSPLLYAFLFSLPLYRPSPPNFQNLRAARTRERDKLPFLSLNALYATSVEKAKGVFFATSSLISSNLVLNPPSLPSACPAPEPQSSNFNSQKSTELIASKFHATAFKEIGKQKGFLNDGKRFYQGNTAFSTDGTLTEQLLDPLNCALKNFFLGVDAGKNEFKHRKFPKSTLYANQKDWKDNVLSDIVAKEHFSDVNNRLRWKSATETADEINAKLREIKEEYKNSPISMSLFGECKYLYFQQQLENFLFKYHLGELSFPWKNMKDFNLVALQQESRDKDVSLRRGQLPLFLLNLTKAQQQMEKDFYRFPLLTQAFEEVPSIPSTYYTTRFAASVYEPREMKSVEILTEKVPERRLKPIDNYTQNVKREMQSQKIHNQSYPPIIPIGGDNLADEMQQMTLGNGGEFGLIHWSAKESIPEDTLELYKKLGGDLNWMRQRLKAFLYAIKIHSFAKIYEIPELDRILVSFFGQLGYKYTVEDPSRLEKLKTHGTINVYDRTLPFELKAIQFVQLKRLFEYRQRLEVYLMPPAHHGGFDQRDYVFKRVRTWISKGIERSYKWNHSEDSSLPTDSHIMACLISNTLQDLLGEEILHHVDVGGDVLSGKSKYSYGKYFLIRNASFRKQSPKAPLHFELQDDQMRIYSLPIGNSNVFQAFSLLLLFLLRFGNERSLESKLPSGFK